MLHFIYTFRVFLIFKILALKTRTPKYHTRKVPRLLPHPKDNVGSLLGCLHHHFTLQQFYFNQSVQ